jgi:tRNA (pseudouridine54-N1)-methyltransferase
VPYARAGVRFRWLDAAVRSFVVIAQKANAVGDWLLDDVPGTSGRIDVLLRCVRAALLTSHGVRHDTRIYLVLERGPRVMRIDGKTVQYLRPDERALAVLARKVLANDVESTSFVEVKPGIALARGGLDVVLAEAPRDVFVLDEQATVDIRDAPLPRDVTFVVGDHLGFSEESRSVLAGVPTVALGPTSLHAEDTVAIVSNELDRRQGMRPR